MNNRSVRRLMLQLPFAIVLVLVGIVFMAELNHPQNDRASITAALGTHHTR